MLFRSPMSQYLSTERRGPVTVVRILWEKVSSRESEILLPEILAAATATPMRLVIDLSQVGLLASPGLGMLITIHKRAGESGGRLVVTGLSQAIFDVLRLTRLDRLLTIEASFDSAVTKAGA